MHINELSSELLVRIFSNIDDFSQKITLERVCRHWRRIIPLNWKATKTCPKPLDSQETLGLVLNRCGEWLEELWLQNVEIDEELVRQMAKTMKQLKHFKIYLCQLDGAAVDSISDLFDQQLYSFILYGTPYLPNMRRLFEKESSKLEHLRIYLSRNYSVGTLPTKMPSNLKSFSLRSWNFYQDTSNLLSIIARDCKNLKVLHLKIQTTLTRNMILAIGNIKSLVYLNLAVTSIQNEAALQNVICNELSNLKALDIGAYFYKKTLSNITRDRPDLIYLNVCARYPFQISDSLNSLTLRIPNYFGHFLPEILFEQPNKSIQYLDIRSFVIPCSSSFIERLLGQFPNLKSLHCEMCYNYMYLTSFFSLIKDHLVKGKKITIYFHDDHTFYYKYILPDHLPEFNTGWRAKINDEKCENLILKKIIKEGIKGGNEPPFMDEWWME